MSMTRNRRQWLLLMTRRRHQRQSYPGWNRFAFPMVAAAAGLLHCHNIVPDNHYVYAFQSIAGVTPAVQNPSLLSSYYFSSSSMVSSRSYITRAEPTKEAERTEEATNSSDRVFDLSQKLNDVGKTTDDFVQKLLGKEDQDSGGNDDNGDQEVSGGDSGGEGFFGSIKSVMDDVVEKGKEIEKKIEGLAAEQKLAADRKSSNSVDRPEEAHEDAIQNFMKLVTSGSTPKESLNDVVAQARSSITGTAGDINDQTTSAKDILDVAQRAVNMLDARLQDFFGSDGLPALSLTSLMYYLEAEDELKNPSWKRRKHRFYPGIDIDKMDELYDKMVLAKLGYADTVEEIQETLAKDYNAELVYATVESLPNKPSHFIAIPRDQSSWSSTLEVIIVVCGTKSISDVLSDLLCDEGEYRGGYAHTGIMESGQWLVEQHSPLLQKLKTLTKKRKLKLSLVGHSLGAGAATIAGIEWNDNKDIDTEVTGFGCPALLSDDLCQKVESFVTTVVDDADCVPRMSMATMVNGLMDIVELDWTPYARRDFNETVEEMGRFLPSLVTDSAKKDMLKKLEGMLPDQSSFTPKEKKRLSPVLFPPGKVIHFYRDGYGVTGSLVPSNFFDELEISRRMLDDHFFLEGYEQIFLSLMRQYHGDNLYSFEKQKDP